MNTKSFLRYSGWTGSKEIIARLVPADSLVLDVGCSSGILGRELEKRKRCALVGVELDSEAASEAGRIYKNVFVGDIETLFPLPADYLQSFDVVIFADVLEHTRNPERVLSHFLSYLKAGGVVIVSLPNVANWLNRFLLFLGKWEYSGCGTLDRTHLRFYNYRSARKLIESAGLSVESVNSTSGLHELDFKAGLYNPSKAWKSLLAYQFIFRCRLER